MTEMLSKKGTWRLCSLCDAFYLSGTYKDHQKEEGHATARADKDRLRNAQYQAEWRQRQKGLRHAG